MRKRLSLLLSITMLLSLFTGLPIFANGDEENASQIFFDDVGIYTQLPAFNLNESPSAENVNITGYAAVGSILSGSYDYLSNDNNDAESGTTFRWLRSSGVDELIFQIHSGAGVSNNPTQPSQFTIDEAKFITEISTYHYYNYGALPGTISLQEIGGEERVFGPWVAVGSLGQGGVVNAYWHVYPNITLPAGTYEVVDSSPSTWSWTNQTGGRGMVYIHGDPVYGDYLPIEDASEQTYTLSTEDLGTIIKLEVTVADSSGNIGEPVTSSAIGPVLPTAAIIDPKPGIIQFEASGLGTYEGRDGWIDVERIDGSDGVVTVDYNTEDGTAIAGTHYVAQSGTLTWEDGDTTRKKIRNIIKENNQYDGYLNFKYVLSNPTGGAKLGLQNPLPVNRSDNDNPPIPTGLSALAGDGEVALKWNEVNSAYYKLYFSTTLGDFLEEDSIGVYDGNSYTIKDLSNNTKYYFAIKSGHNIYYSDFSEIISATPKAPTPPISSGGGGSSTNYYTVSQETNMENGKVSFDRSRAAEGNKVNIMVAPDTGYVLDVLRVFDKNGKGINFTENKDGSFTFEMPKGNVKVEASFIKKIINPETLPELDEMSFDDIIEGDWFYKSVIYINKKALMVGSGDNKFSPNENANRAMIATVLSRLEKNPKINANSFTDVAPGTWYYNSVSWAADNKIVVGYGNNLFGPMDDITREQLASILYNYANYKGYNTANTRNLDTFTDKNEISKWARTTMSWAVDSGIIVGKYKNKLSPTDTATRAEVATMLKRFLERTEK